MDNWLQVVGGNSASLQLELKTKKEMSSHRLQRSIHIITATDGGFQKWLKMLYSLSFDPPLFLPQIIYFLLFAISLYGLMETLQHFLFVWLITMTLYN